MECKLFSKDHFKYYVQVEERLKFYETGDLPRKNVDVMNEAVEEAAAEAKKKKKKEKKKPAAAVGGPEESKGFNWNIEGHKDYEYSELLDRIENIMNEKNA